jgi:hypothetical protein
VIGRVLSNCLFDERDVAATDARRFPSLHLMLPTFWVILDDQFTTNVKQFKILSLILERRLVQPYSHFHTECFKPDRLDRRD